MMMSNMQRARSRSAQVSPEFVDLCKTLYGDLIDAEVIWDDVLKAGPDPTDVSTHDGTGGIKRQVLRGTALAGAGLGGYLGVKEFAQGAQGLHAARKLKVPMPPKAKKALMVGGALMPMDALEMGVIGSDLMHHKKKGQLVAVHKGVASEVMAGAKKMKDGYLKLWNPAAHVAKPPIVGHTPTPAGAKAIGANDAKATKQIAQGTDVANMLNTTSGKVLAGGTAAVGGVKAKNAVKPKSSSMSYVPDGMSKSIPDIEWKGTFSKFDEDKHLAFGWASVVSKGGVPVIDKQGDYIAIEDIEDAAYSYVKKSRVGGDNHTRNGQVAHKVSDLVESMVFTDDKIAKMGLPEDFPRGWWVGFKVHDDDVWSEVRKGNRTGFSIHGRGIRSEQSVDDLMGYTA